MFLHSVSYESILFFVVIMPFIAAFFTTFSRRSANFKRIGLIAINFFHIFNLISLLFSIKASGTISLPFLELTSELKLSFNANKMSIIFCIFVSILWLATNLYSFGYLGNENNKEQSKESYNYIAPGRFYFFLCLSIGFVNMAALSGNLFTLYSFYELLSFATYPLVAVTGSPHAKKAAKKYLIYLFSASVLLFLPAMIYILLEVGDLSFTHGGFLANKISNFHACILFLAFVFGIAKAAIFPLSYWLPIAMAAPHPVSALLHAVAVVKTGIFALIKISIFVFGIDFLREVFNYYINIPLIFAIFTIFFAGIMACKQQQIKKILAFSTIGHLSVCLMAIFLFTSDAVNAGFLYMIAHGVTKITLFFIAGFLYSKYKITDLADLPGVMHKEKVVFICLTIASLSLIGMPFLACFPAKHLIFQSMWEDANFIILVTLYILSSCFTAYYMFMIVYNAYLDKNFVNSDLEKQVSTTKAIKLMRAMVIFTTSLIIVLPYITISLN